MTDLPAHARLDALTAELEALRATLADIAAGLPLAELLPALVRRAVTLLSAHRGELVLYDADAGDLVIYAAHNTPGSVPGRRIAIGEGLSGRVAATRQPIILDDYTTWEGRIPSYVGDGPGAAVAVPLLAGDQLVGVLDIGRAAAQPFTPDDAAQLDLFAKQATVAIRNARLLEDARRRADEAETLRRVGAVVASTLRQEEAIERILEQLALVVPYDSASVQLLRGDALEIVGGRGFRDRDAVIGIRFPLDGPNPNGMVYRLRAAVRLPDAPAAYATFRTAPHNHIHSWLGAPMIVQDRMIGMIAVDSTQPYRFTADHERTVLAFASQAAIALENARLFAETRRLAITDPLLGIFNRRHFFEVAQAELERSRRYQHPLAIVMIDIDDFKRINDTYGHLVGDHVLRGVANRCRSALRTVDVLGRYGGEELVVLMPETDAAGALDAAERLRLAIAQAPVDADGTLVFVTASFGVASRDAAEAAWLEEVLDRADRALYEAKSSGRNRVRVL